MKRKEIFEQNLNQLEAFSKYVIEHPDILDLIPNDAQLVFLPEGNKKLQKENLKLLKKEKTKKPVVFIRMIKVPQIKEVMTEVPQLEVVYA